MTISFFQILPCGILNEKCPLRLRDLSTSFTVGGVVEKVLEPLGGRDLMGKVYPWAGGSILGVHSLIPPLLPSLLCTLQFSCLLPAAMPPCQDGLLPFWTGSKGTHS